MLDTADRTPNWDKWRLIADLEPWECVALSLNIDPRKVRFNRYGGCTPEESQEFNEHFKDRLEVVNANLRRALKCKGHKVDLRVFAAWLRERTGWAAPAELLAMADEHDPGKQKTPTAAEGKANGKPPKSSLLPFRAPARQNDWVRVISAMKTEFESEHGRSPNETEAWTRLRTNPPKGYDVRSVTVVNDETISIGNSVSNNPLTKKAFVKRWRRYTGPQQTPLRGNKAIKGQ